MKVVLFFLFFFFFFCFFLFVGSAKHKRKNQPPPSLPFSLMEEEESIQSVSPRTIHRQENVVLYRFKGTEWVDSGRGSFLIRALSICFRCGSALKFCSHPKADAYYRCESCSWTTSGLPSHRLWVELIQNSGRTVFVGQAIPKVTTFDAWPSHLNTIRIQKLGEVTSQGNISSLSTIALRPLGKPSSPNDVDVEQKGDEEEGEEKARKQDEDEVIKKDSSKNSFFSQERVAWEVIDILKQYPGCLNRSQNGNHIRIFTHPHSQLLRLRDGNEWVDSGFGKLLIDQTSSKFYIKFVQSGTGRILFHSILGKNARFLDMNQEHSVLLSSIDYTRKKEGEPCIVAFRLSSLPKIQESSEDDELLLLDQHLSSLSVLSFFFFVFFFSFLKKKILFLDFN